MVREQADGPPFLLRQDHARRPGAPFLRAQAVIGGGRPQESRTQAPDQPARRRLGRREEEALGGIAQPEILAVRVVVAVGDGQDRADDQVPVGVEGDRDHGLDVCGPDTAVAVRATIEVDVALDRYLISCPMGCIAILQSSSRLFAKTPITPNVISLNRALL